MAKVPVAPVVLVVLDGWGYSEEIQGNAIATAKTPVMDSLWTAYPHTLIHTSGQVVGLPEGQMGNSEVGHSNLGAGRIVRQELVRIRDAVENGSINQNITLVELCQAVKSHNGKLHFVGLCSNGGVHSHISHLFGLLNLAKSQGISDVCIHAITDGRDTKPKDGLKAIGLIQEYLERIGIGLISTISGRYYAMDRDHRWDRIRKAYNVMVQDNSGDGRSAVKVLEESYAEGITDEFIVPIRIAPGAVKSGDGLLFFNFRADRARQLTQAFVSPLFNNFPRDHIQPLNFVTLTQYDPELQVKVAFKPPHLSNILGEVLAKRGLKQFRIAETEKYAHVTYFFNGSVEKPFPGEDREIVNSPIVATYDSAPSMSAEMITDLAITAMNKGIYSMVVINYANPDMVGHTGQMEATIQAIEIVDKCVARLVNSVSKVGGTTIVTADHGNAEHMIDEEGHPWTAHTDNPVPFILVEGEKVKIPGYGTEVTLRSNGKLSDIAPTILEILQIPKPEEMTGESLVQISEYEVELTSTPLKIGW